MAQELVRVRIGDSEVSVGRSYAVAKGLDVLDEPAADANGRALRQTRAGGRPVKRKTSVDREAAAKKKDKAAVTESAPTDKETAE